MEEVLKGVMVKKTGFYISALLSYFSSGFLLLLVLMDIKPELGLQTGYFIWGTVGVAASALMTLPFSPGRMKMNWADLLVVVFSSYLIINYLFISDVYVPAKFLNLLYILALYFPFRIITSAYGSFKYYVFALLITGGLVESVIGLKQALGFTHSNHGLYSITGTFFNPGPYGGYLAVIMAMSLHYIVRHYRYFERLFKNIMKRPLLLVRKPEVFLYLTCWLTFIMSFIIFFAVMSRGAMVALAVAVMAVLVSQKNIRKSVVRFVKKNKKLSIGVLFLCVVSVVVVTAVLYNHKKESAAGRFHIWNMSSQIIADNPCFGSGFGTFFREYADVQAKYFREYPDSPTIPIAGCPEYKFNEYLGLGVETGLAGLGLFLLIAGLAAYALLRNKDPLGYGLIALLIFALSSYPFAIIPFQIFLLLFISSGASYLGKDKFVYSKPLLVVISVVTLLCAVSLRWLYFEKIEAVKEAKTVSMLYNSEIYESVVKDYAALYPLMKDDPRFMFEYGRTLNKIGAYIKSNSILKEGASLSCDPMFYNVIGNNYKALGEFDLAEQYYTYAFEILPNRLYPLYLLMQLYDESGQTEKAKEMAERVRSFDPKVRSSATDDMQKEAREL